MPATTIVVFESEPVLAGRLAGALTGLPARLRQARGRKEFLESLAAGPFPVAFLSAEVEWETLVGLLRDAFARSAVSIVVGRIDRWPRMMELRELNACSLLGDDLSAGKWRSLIRRLVEQSQERIGLTG